VTFESQEVGEVESLS